MKKFTEIMGTVAMVATLVFFGYVAGTNKDALIKAYNYGCYLATHTEETEVVSGQLMNINIVKGEMEAPLEMKDTYTIVGRWTNN